MANIHKLFEKAEKLLKKQRFDSALEVFIEIDGYQPHDEAVLLNMGDLSLKLDRTADALRYWGLLSGLYIKRNDFSKAIATCRKSLKLAPHNVETLATLAGLLEKIQKTSEALAAYREALEAYQQSGQTARSIECLQHIIVLDPTDIESRIKLGELAAPSGQSPVAAAAFLEAAKLARNQGEEAHWAELVEKAHRLDPSNEAACIQAAELFIKKDLPNEAIALLEPIVQTRPDDLTVLDYLTRAYLHTGQYTKAEPLSARLFQAHPFSVDLVEQLVQGLAKSGETEKALNLIEQAKAHFYQQDRQKEFLAVFEKIHAADQSNLKALEILPTLYSDMNNEDGLRRSLTRLFNLYLANEQYNSAADTLERIIDVEPFGAAHQDRLLNLEGHIDPILYRNIANRIQLPAAKSPGDEEATEEGTLKKPEEIIEPLEGLIIEGEMYHQYKLSPKLMETLSRIDRLYPGAHKENTRLQELCELASFHPTPVQPSAPQAAAGQGAMQNTSAESVEELQRVSQIIANIYREGAPERIMHVAVDQIGHTLGAHRCWGALGSVSPSPGMMAEYHSADTPPSDPSVAAKVYFFFMQQAGANPEGWSFDDAARSPFLTPIAPELWTLGITSLLAVPLLDKEEPSGLILLEQCRALRTWSPGEKMFLRAIAPQVAIAVSDTRLRKLVRSLAGTDHVTGLLPRTSYLDCLLAEASRAKEQSQSVSVCLIEPVNATRLAHELGEAKIQALIRLVSKSLTSHLRQNDMAIRYSPYTLAVCFSGTTLGQAKLAIQKLQTVFGQIKIDGKESLEFCAAACDLHMGPRFDPIDGVTEIINRLEASIECARSEGKAYVLISQFEG